MRALRVAAVATVTVGLGYWWGAVRLVPPPAVLFLTTVLVVLLLRALWPGLKRVGIRDAALTLDARAGLKDELLSAVEFVSAPSGTPMEALQIRRARRTLESLPAGVVAPGVPRQSLVVTAAMTGTAVTLAALIATHLIGPGAITGVERPGRPSPVHATGGTENAFGDRRPDRAGPDSTEAAIPRAPSPGDPATDSSGTRPARSPASDATEGVNPSAPATRHLNDVAGLPLKRQERGADSADEALVAGQAADRSLLERIQDLFGASRSDSRPIAGGNGPERTSPPAAAVHPHESVESATLRMAVGDVGKSDGAIAAIRRGEATPSLVPEGAMGEARAIPDGNEGSRRTITEAAKGTGAAGAGLSGNRSAGLQEAPDVLGAKTARLPVRMARVRIDPDDRDDPADGTGPYVATRRQSSDLEATSAGWTSPRVPETPNGHHPPGYAQREAVRRYFLDLNRRDSP